MEHMRRGRFEEAWRISDEVLAERDRLSCDDLPRHERWVWRGESLRAKRVFVRCYHGLGDTVQFVRYISLVRQVASSVVLEAQPELISLLRLLCDPADEFVALATPFSDYEVAVELMELPHLFRTTVATIPATVPYF